LRLKATRCASIALQRLGGVSDGRLDAPHVGVFTRATLGGALPCAIARCPVRKFIKGLGLDETPEQTEPEPPPQYAKLGMTKAELLLCAVLDMKLRTQLDDESCPKALALDTFRQVKDLVMKIVKNAPPGMTQVEKFMVVTTLFPNAKLKLARLTPEGELEAFDTGAKKPCYRNLLANW